VKMPADLNAISSFQVSRRGIMTSMSPPTSSPALIFFPRRYFRWLVTYPLRCERWLGSRFALR
jgi:hypothetical protein